MVIDSAHHPPPDRIDPRPDRRYVCLMSSTEPLSPLSPLAGKAALVTGAARPRGIGRPPAVHLARCRADTACLDIARPYDAAPAHGTASAGELDELAAELRGLGVRVATAVADVSVGEEVENAVARVSEELGTVTLVANVAGGRGPGLGPGPLLNIRSEERRVGKECR